MTIEVSKQSIGAEQAIVWKFNEAWQWKDFLAAVEDASELLDADQKEVCLILNMRHDLPEEQLALTNIRHAIKRFEGCDIIFVMEGAAMSSNITLKVFKEEFPELSEKTYIVHTMDDAYLHVDPHYMPPN